MKRLIMAAAVAATLLGTLKVMATPVYVDRISGYYYGNGGEINISPVLSGGYAPSVLVNNGYETFCVETAVHIILPGNYDASLSQFDSQGTALTMGTAWLYQQFATGVLTGYDYDPLAAGGNFLSRSDAAGALQNTIWALQGQSYNAGLAAYYLGIVAANVGTPYAANNGAVPVSIVNLVDATGAPVQNMLALPDGGSTLMLLGMALSGIGMLFRKLRSC